MKRILPYSLVLSLCLVLLLPACVTTQPTTTQPSARFVSPKLIEVPTGRGNVNTPIWWMPHDAAQATLVLFLGGPGALGPNDNDALNDPNSWEGHPAFMLRDWELFYKEGFNVAIVGRAQDRVQEQDNRSRNPLPFRTSAEHSSDIRNVLLNIKKLAPEGGIWLVGSSLGTISIANATITNPDIIAGQVMLGGVTHLGGTMSPSGRAFPASGLDFGEIRVPTLILHHSQDMCWNSLPEHARDNFAALNNAPRKELVFLDGGRPSGSEPCSPQYYHGFPGLEKEVVMQIAAWIRDSP